MTISLDRMRTRIQASILVDGNGCWIWQKTKSPNGYGAFAFGGGQNVGAHRVAYQAYIGEIPTGADVCHRCDIRSCVNPEHLFTGTRAENIQDASRKKRLSDRPRLKGADHPAAKLNDEKVADILARLREGDTKSSLARHYGVTDRVILLISRGELWRHIPRAA